MAKVMIIGSGGREHALGWKISQSPDVSEVLYSPGNAGTEEGKGRNIPLDAAKPENFDALTSQLRADPVDLVIVGPEAPLVSGIEARLKDIAPVFGPSSDAAALEADKFFSYRIMSELDIPQALSIICRNTEDAKLAIRTMNGLGAARNGLVMKARGLTGGKGVYVCDSVEEALDEVAIHGNKYGHEVLIAERLVGEEFSVFGISDGKRVIPLEFAVQDHKRLLDNDQGVNTGGMGAYGPTSIAKPQLIRRISEDILTPVISKMRYEGREYKGFIYAGIMLTEEGPKVLEFNVRFGDPECQPAMMLVKNDLYHLLSAAVDGTLHEQKIECNPGSATCVILASRGYPEQHQKGSSITGIAEAENIRGVKVFHSGTAIKDGQLVTSGGRILGVTAYSEHGIEISTHRAYQAASLIQITDGFRYRRDIARSELNRNEPF
ncbi:phosphoribosylamine--glycine ligase [Candidatus Woesearchaeota archaeon]|nr:phosphoribosylamine--glycine ligase [Candidatus Woesearchaeota archaeon]